MIFMPNTSCKLKKIFIQSLSLLMIVNSCNPLGLSQQKNIEIEKSFEENKLKEIESHKFTIKDIIISGNKNIKNAPILNRIPYKIGDLFDASKSTVAMNNLYNMGHFRQIQIEGEIISNDDMNLYIIVEEKKILESLSIKGNKALSTEKIKEKLNIEKITSIDEESLRQLSIGIQNMYKEENRHFVKVSYELIPNKEKPEKASVLITITDGPKSAVFRVQFKGNTHVPDRKLRNLLFTRENWLFGFTDSAGTYNEDAIEMDKHRIEYFYRDHGYLTAKVIKTDVEFSKTKKQIQVTFHIKEGNQFTVRSIHTPGDEFFVEEELLPLVSLEEGKAFSQSKLVESMNKMRDLWGEKGYIYADVYPQIKPDETTNEVDVTLHVERSNKMYANRINITGNKITRDKVIRRQLEITEGDLITTKALQKSKSSVEYLSFFERDGVNWKLHRIADELADLEMNIKEAKTGNFNFQLTYGSDVYNPRPSMRGMITLEKSNLCGLGWDVGGLIQASRHRFQRIEGHFFDPNLFDSNISGGLYVYKRWDEYEQWRNVDKTPLLKTMGADVKFGFGLPKLDKRMHLILDIGIEKIKSNNPQANRSIFVDFQPIVERSFQTGTLTWIGLDMIKDTRNHQVYPNQGYKIVLSTKTGLPGINKEFGFFKTEAGLSCYNALIGIDSLVLAAQIKVSRISQLGGDRIIPYKELSHMGGQTTIRGHVWGGVGPAWITGDPLGGRNAIQLNTELVFPLIDDYSMKGHLFYDAGSGWDTPRNGISDMSNVKRNNFDVRQSVGFGLNLLKPMPAKIDWGYKLDRRKQDGESAYEFHLQMNYAW